MAAPAQPMAQHQSHLDSARDPLPHKMPDHTVSRQDLMLGVMPGNTSSQRFNAQMHWSARDEIRLRVRGLPRDVTTLEVMDIFAREGAVSRIELAQHPDGSSKGFVNVNFTPPPRRAFWAFNGYEATIEQRQQTVKLRFELLDLTEPTFYTGLHTGKQYPEVMLLTAESLDFGVSYDEETMMIFHSAHALPSIPITLRQSLRFRDIEVSFPVQFRKDTSASGEKNLE